MSLLQWRQVKLSVGPTFWALSRKTVEHFEHLILTLLSTTANPLKIHHRDETLMRQ